MTPAPASASARPRVSVSLLTYNHADFIAKSLDSALMQRVSFKFEIVVGDDCSTDATREVIRDYQRRFPDIVKPLFREKNVGMGRNARETFETCAGDYVAMLEGDDYWTDPCKLQAQVEYLDAYPDCALCCHKVEHILWPGGTTLREYPGPAYRVERPDPRALAMVNYIQTCSVMYRRKWLPSLDAAYEQLKLGDWPLFVLLTQRGRVGYLDRTMSHYRVHASNSWNSRPADYKLRAMEAMAWYLLERVDADSKKLWQDMILALACKDLILAVRSFRPARAFERLNHFAGHLMKFRKPFWVFNRLWPYYRANYLTR